ncbi:MAG: WD40 repeat domain-containing protein, partial [bacterium]
MCLPKGTTSLHSLIATGSGGSSAIVLCDVNSGASVHTLEGHGGSVQCLTWSPTNDYQLCSGSIDGTARLWDIRKPGSHSCVCILNYHGPNHEHSNYFSISDGKEAT